MISSMKQSGKSAIIDKIEEIPAFPPLAMKIMEATMDEKTSAHKLAGLIETDNSLSIRLLRMANSSYYGLPYKVVSVQNALVVLGIDVVRSLVLSISLADMMAKWGEMGGFDVSLFWLHSLACGIVARSLSQQLGYKHHEAAFTAGMIHDLGRFIMARFLPEDYQKWLQLIEDPQVDPKEAERNIYEIDHAQMGKLILESWQFPPLLKDAVSYHHDNSSELIGREDKLPAIVSAADSFCWASGFPSDPHQKIPAFDIGLWRSLGLSEPLREELEATLYKDILELLEMFPETGPQRESLLLTLQKANTELAKINLILNKSEKEGQFKIKLLGRLLRLSSIMQTRMRPEDVIDLISEYLISSLDFRRVIGVLATSKEKALWSEIDVSENSDLKHSMSYKLVGEARAEWLKIKEDNPGEEFELICQKRTIGKILALPVKSEEEKALLGIFLELVANLASFALEKTFLHQRIIEMERFRSVTNLALTANHHINSPLTTILLSSELLLKKKAATREEFEGILRRIYKEALSIAEVVRKLNEINSVIPPEYLKDQEMPDIQHLDTLQL